MKQIPTVLKAKKFSGISGTNEHLPLLRLYYVSNAKHLEYTTSLNPHNNFISRYHFSLSKLKFRADE